MDMQHDRARRRFHELLAHYHARSGLSCSAVAELSGVSTDYLADLLNGRRWRIRPHTLRMLCERGWGITASEGHKLLRLRLDADPCMTSCAYLPVEIHWELAGSRNVREMAQQLNIDSSYLSKIVSGKRRPTLAVVMRIFCYFGYDMRRAAHLYSIDMHGDKSRSATTVS